MEAVMDLAAIPREFPQFGKSVSNVARTRSEAFGESCGAASGSSPVCHTAGAEAESYGKYRRNGTCGCGLAGRCTCKGKCRGRCVGSERKGGASLDLASSVGFVLGGNEQLGGVSGQGLDPAGPWSTTYTGGVRVFGDAEEAGSPVFAGDNPVDDGESPPRVTRAGHHTSGACSLCMRGPAVCTVIPASRMAAGYGKRPRASTRCIKSHRARGTAIAGIVPIIRVCDVRMCVFSCQCPCVCPRGVECGCAAMFPIEIVKRFTVADLPWPLRGRPTSGAPACERMTRVAADSVMCW